MPDQVRHDILLGVFIKHGSSYTEAMSNVLALCSSLPELHVPAGTRLIEEGVPMGRIYVVKRGEFEVVRDGVRVVVISEAGAFMGEISALLGSAPMADVVAMQESTVYVVDDAEAATHRDPQLTYAIAQLLARRLQAVTSYLVDIKRQYADSDSHLGLMDQVLANLMAIQQPSTLDSGSERRDVPDY
jgi:CRP/FNR family cyclic AMP-dependent transcriptional regulator